MNMNMNMNPNMGMNMGRGMNMGMQMNPNVNMNPMIRPGMNPQMNVGMNMPPQNQFQGQFNTTFICGKIGNKEIAKEDLPTFKSNLKETEWTQNPIYKNAKNADVQLTFNPKEKRNNNMPNFQRANIDSYLLEIGPYLSEFNNYANDCVSKNAKMADEVEQKKNEFIKTCFPSDADIDVFSMFEKIKKNRCFILSKDQVLYKKLEHYLPFLVDEKTNNNNNSNPILLNQVPQNINQNPPPSFGYQQQQNSQAPPQPQYNNMNYGYNNPPNSIYGNNPPPNNVYGNMSNRGYYQ